MRAPISGQTTEQLSKCSDELRPTYIIRHKVAQRSQHVVLLADGENP
jgi:hypothetical protein